MIQTDRPTEDLTTDPACRYDPAMPTMTVRLQVLRCQRCGHEWIPRRIGPLPEKCANRAKCGSPYWNTPRRRDLKKRTRRAA